MAAVLLLECYYDSRVGLIGTISLESQAFYGDRKPIDVEHDSDIGVLTVSDDFYVIQRHRGDWCCRYLQG